MARVFVLCLFIFWTSCVIAEESFERVKRAPGRNCPRITNFNGKVKYRRKGTRAVFRCGKSFTRYGNKAVNCRADNTWTGEPPVCIKANCVPKDIRHLEKLDMTEMYQGALLTFSCEDDYKLIGITEIYCNGKVWNANPPVCKAPKQLLECDFEGDLCGWSQDESDDLDWIRNQGQTSTGGTGPRIDHTLQTSAGHYMFVESSNPATTGDEARLMSPLYPTDMGNMCFEFWYHILGPDDTGHVGTLEVYIIGESEFLDDLQPVFVKDGNQGDEWKRAEIYVDKRDEPYQIVIATVRKLSYISDIAIDDVKLYNCSGLTTTSLSRSTSKTTTTSVPPTSASSPKSSKTQSTVPTDKPVPTTLSASTTIRSSASTSVTSASSAKPSAKSTTTNTVVTTSTSLLSKDTTSVAVTSTEATTSTTKTPTTVESTTKSSTLSKTSLTQTTEILTTAQPSTSKTTSTLLTTTPPASTTTTSPSTSTLIPTTKKRPTTTQIPLTTSTYIPTTTSQRTTITSMLISTSKTTVISSSAHPDTPSTTKTSTTIKSTTRTKPTKVTTKAKPTKPTRRVKPTKPTTRAKPTKRPTTKAKNTKSPSKMTTKGLISTSPVSVDKTETTGSGVNSPTTKSNNTDIKISIAEQRAQHPDDDTLKPLMIGLGVGIFCGLIIIGVVAWVCVRRKKFYTRGYEDELKPITKSSSNDNFTGIQYEYHDDEYEQ